MGEYVVRWKFGPNSLINHLDVETPWYHQTHKTKKEAEKHYFSALDNMTPGMAGTVEILHMVKVKSPQRPKEVEL